MSSILYLAPFFEKSVYGESATAYVKALSKKHNVICRSFGKKEQSNDYIKQFFKNEPCVNLIIQGEPADFYYDSRYNCIGITHFKTPLIEETNFRNRFWIMDHVFHDTSIQIDGVTSIKPAFDKIEPKRKDRDIYRFLIVGEPTSYEEIFSVIKAYCEEFRIEENVDLTLKIPTKTNLNQFRDAIMQIQSDLKKMNTGMYAPIGFNSIWLPRKELLEFYTDYDCIINCSLHNSWSRPFIEFGMIGGRGISILDDPDLPTKMAYGMSDSKDYPRGRSITFPIETIRRLLRENFNKKESNYKDLDSFLEIPESLEKALI